MKDDEPEAASEAESADRTRIRFFSRIRKELFVTGGLQVPLRRPQPLTIQVSSEPGLRVKSGAGWRSWRLGWPEFLVLLAVLFNLWVLRAERLPVAYPNDSAVHLQMVTLAQHLLSNGQFPLDHWYPYLSQGSPFFVQYQSASAILAGALGQVIGPQQALSWTLYLLLSLWPLCIYWSGRLLGWNRWASAASAAVSPLLFSITGYGYEHQSYVAIGNGLWSQLWAMWTLPLAWGFSWRFVSQRRYLFGAVFTLALTIAFHFLTAYLAGLSLIVWILLATS